MTPATPPAAIVLPCDYTRNRTARVVCPISNIAATYCTLPSRMNNRADSLIEPHQTGTHVIRNRTQTG